MTMPAEETIQLDWRGMKCPQPIINTAKISRELGARRARLVILADDEAFPLDLKAWVKSAKAELLTIQQLPDEPHTHQAIVIINPQAQLVAEQAIQAPVARAFSPQAAPLKPEPVAAVASAAASQLDCRGMRCPEPIIALAKHAREADPGQLIEIHADDEAFPIDLKAWAKSAKAEIVAIHNEQGLSHATIKLAGQDSPPEAAIINAERQPKKSAPSQTQAPSAPQSHAQPTTVGANTLQISLTQAQGLQRLEALGTLGLSPGTTIELSLDALSLVPTLTQWAIDGGHTIKSMDTSHQPIRVNLELGDAAPPQSTALARIDRPGAHALSAQEERATLLVLHNDLEALLAAMMVATSAATQGLKVEIFFSFWGVNMLRGDKPRQDAPKERASWAQRLFKLLMPRGPKRQALGQLNFGGFGSTMLQRIMREQNVMSLEQMMQTAVEMDIQFTVCTMSMSVMGIAKRDLVNLPNMEFAGVASFVESAGRSKISMVF